MTKHTAASASRGTHAASLYRLPRGGLIDRATSLGFSFDGRTYAGCAGDTLASALVANGVRVVGRSFKYHRPRGIFTAGTDEPNALVELRDGTRREPDTRATTIELLDGLIATKPESVAVPRLRRDGGERLALAPLTSWLLLQDLHVAAGILEKIYEPSIRRAAGLGRAAGADDPDEYEKAFAHCDVLVIGSGPTGLMAALVAARAGARVRSRRRRFQARRTPAGGASGARRSRRSRLGCLD